MRKIPLGYFRANPTARKYVDKILDSGRLSYGSYTQQLENLFAELHGCRHAVFMNSGTSALQVALATLKEVHGYEDGDEVLVPATTFIATSNIVLQNNLKPVFVDVNPDTFNIDPSLIEAAITPRTRAIIPVHLFGLPAAMPSIMQIAKDQQLQVIEDSCETMFAGIRGKSVGSWGDLACFSTYVAHIIVGGVGGLITTNDPVLADVARSYMAHGRNTGYLNIDRDDNLDDPRFHEDVMTRRYEFQRLGYSYRATEFEAALALSEIENNAWVHNITTRRLNASYLKLKLEDIPHLQLPWRPSLYDHSFMMFPMVARDDVNRDDLLMFMESHGIETRYMFPLLSQPVYKKLFPRLDVRYPVAQRLAAQGFFIGIHQGLTIEDLDYISEVIHEYFGDHL